MLTANKASKVLIDCGLFQGKKEWRERNWQPPPIPAHEIDAIILTHAHLDHSGYIPRLVRAGFRGRIYATAPTIDLCSVILPDSGHLQEEEAHFHNKKGTSKHSPALPLYTLQEAEDCLPLFRPIEFGVTEQLGSQLSVRLVRAGHILGSCMVELFLSRNGRQHKLLFSGDIGRVPLPGSTASTGVHTATVTSIRVLDAGPEPGEDPDLLVMESTYGNRVHLHEDVRPQLAQLIKDTVHRGGSVVVPAFAVERTQKFLFVVKELMESGQIPRIPVFLDSPMAIKAVEIFTKYSSEFTEETRKLVKHYGTPLNWQGFHFAPRQEESKKINEIHYPSIIVSASGMATGGRVLHHLMQRLPDPRNQVIFIGFQAPGTRGDIIQSGGKSVRIFSQEVPIRAHVAALEQFSDHADKEELLCWLQTFKKQPKSTFLVHGEPEAASALQQAISSKLGWKVRIANWMEKVELSTLTV